ncbi:hypothetical protein PMKS-001537 [Pichia membranifaciens]|uniref:Uncharacterized protein n=1 Tax=Pichia membranifaciens TaxID=4926 RepID=A0A1Q2YEV8_9ASCO|nr:hypothetical protein PMKS-001537 [Pichia membranifaciens]
MTFLPLYYRRSYTQENDIENTIGSVKNKTDTYEKIDKTLDSIYNSSKTLQSLKFKDTCSLYDLLQNNGIELKKLYNNFNNGSLKRTESDNYKMDMDADMEDADKDDEEEASALSLIKEQLHKHITLKEVNEKKSPLVLGLLNLPNDILEYPALVENVLDNIIKLIFDRVQFCRRKDNGEEIRIAPGYQWSYMGVKTANVETQTVYVVVDDAMMAYLFAKSMKLLDLGDQQKELHIISSKDLDEKIFPKLDDFFQVDLEKLQSVKDDARKHIVEMKKTGMKAKEKDTPVDDYLTRFKRLSETYRVDPKDLSDVPADMVDIVKQNIIDFRLHVLTDLENKQNERMLKDKLEAQKQMGELQNESSAINAEPSADGRPYNRVEYPNYGTKQGMSDIEFESMLQSKEKSTLEKNYYIKLGQYKKKEDARLKNYMNFQLVLKHDSYVSKVIPQNRKRFFDNFVSNVKDVNNKIDLNFNYYTKHANYAQYREKIRMNEEAKDKMDLEEETKEKLEGDILNTTETVSHTQESSAKEPMKEEKRETQDIPAEEPMPEEKEEIKEPSTDSTGKMDIDDPSSEQAEPTIPISDENDDRIIHILSQNTGIQFQRTQIEFIKSFLNTVEHIDKRSKHFRDLKKKLQEEFNLETKALNKAADDIFHLRSEL